MKKISLITPFYGRAKFVQTFLENYENVLKDTSLEYEIVIVDDSKDENTFIELIKCKSKFSHLKIIKLSKNWGQHPALLAGIEYATGDYIVITDCDLQEDPRNILNYLEKINEYDIVIGEKRIYKTSFLSKVLSKIFWKIFNYFSKIKYNPNQVTQRIFTKKVRDSILMYKDQNIFWGGIFQDIGFKLNFHPIKHKESIDKKSSYNFKSKISLAITFITSFSISPLRISSAISIGMFFLSILSLFYVLYLKFVVITPIGYASMITVILFCSGFQLLALGIIGEYLSKTFSQSMQRPRYLIREIVE